MADKETDKPADDNKIDHYVKQGLIASGKHAQVWEAQEENTANRFALKVLLPEAMLDPEQVQILKYEGKVAQSLDHPNVIKWFATVHRKTNIYLVMELFRALNIKNFIANDAAGVQMRLRKIIDCTCLALQHMHEKGWIHLDVKPDNILLNRSSEVKLIDFSLSKKVKGMLGNLLGGKNVEIGGTLTYIAPETIRKDGLTPQTDIYSLGITIYECLTGTTPFKGSSPKDLLMKHLATIAAPPSDYNKNVTPEMDRMVMRMLAKKPKDRQKNMQEVMSEFRSLQIFKEDPEAVFAKKVQDAKDGDMKQTLGKRLDSRTDHSRSEDAKTNPEMARQLAANAKPAPDARQSAPDLNKKPDPKKPVPTPKPATAQTARPPMPMQPQMMQPPMMQPPMMPPQMMPGYPQQQSPYAPLPGMPGIYMPMPGYPMQMPMPGMPQAMPGYPPGAGGGMPGMFPQGMPPQGYPMMPNAGQMPGMPPGAPPPMQMPQQPLAPQPQPIAPQQPVQAKPVPRALQRPAPPPMPENVGELPTMDELPDVM